MSTVSQLSFDVLCKILADPEVPADTKMELEKDLNTKLFHPLQISSEFREKLARVYTNRIPKPMARFETQLYQNGRLTVIHKLGAHNLYYQIKETRSGRQITAEYEAAKYFTKNAREYVK